MKETFESLLENVSFMKSVFAVMESIRQESRLSPEGKFRLQKSQVSAIYGTHGISLTDDQYFKLVDYCKDAEETVAELSDDEMGMLAAGLDVMNNVSKSDIRQAAENLRNGADMLDSLV